MTERQLAAAGSETFGLKTALAQIDVTPGNPDINVAKMLDWIQTAKANGDEVLVFPEMCVPGYLIGDDWLDDSLVKDFERYNQAIIEATANSDMIVIWGNVRTDDTKKNEDGTLRKYNTVYIAQGGVLKGERYKTAMPNYGEFDDKRYFTSTTQLAYESGRSIESYMTPVEVEVRNTKIAIGLAVCEDGWASGEANDYPYDVMKMLSERGAEVFFNLSRSPVKNGKNYRRNQIFGDVAKRAGIPLGYCNGVGIENNGKNIIPFDGASTLYNADGSLQVMKDDFQEGLVRGELDVPLRSAEAKEKIRQIIAQQADLDAVIQQLRAQQQSGVDALILESQPGEVIIDAEKRLMATPENRERQLENIYQMLLAGTKNFFETAGLSKVVIGLSGGADSALVAKIMVDALGAENVYAVNMPTKNNSDLTKGLAHKLANQLGIHYAVVPIQDSYDQTVLQLNGVEFDYLGDEAVTSNFPLSAVNKENVQARARSGEILAGLASAIGAVFTNNGNKSETLAGYATLYGDVAGALAPIGDLYKSEVWDLMNYLTEKEPALGALAEIAATLPSAELSSDQNPETGQGDPFYYPYHDKIWYQIVEMRKNPEDLLSWYEAGTLSEKINFDESLPTEFAGDVATFIDDIERCYRLFKRAIFKRVQAPPNIRVSRKGTGYDFRESMLQGPIYYTQGYRETKERLLNS